MENPTLGCGPHNVRKSEICRLCMKSHEYYLNIFVIHEEFTTSIGKTIEDLLVLKVAKGDNLPEMVCCPCVTKLMEFREFKEMCMNSAREFGRHAPKEPITCPVKDEFLPMHLLCEATSGTLRNRVDGESRVPMAPNDLSMDTFAFEHQTDTKGVYPRDPLQESDECGEEDFAETEWIEDASVCSGTKQILMDDQGEVKEELEVTEVVGSVESHSREILDEGDSSDTGGPILLSDILAVMGMVDRCHNIGGLAEELEKESDQFGTDRQGFSQKEVLKNPSCDSLCEENLQLECYKPNCVVVDCLPERRVKNRTKNLKFYPPSKKFPQFKDRAKPVRNHEDEKLCHQAENTIYPTEYICSYCNTRYSEKHSLALHIKIHVDGMRSGSVLPKKEFQRRLCPNLLVKALKSNECGKMFSLRSDISRHLVVRTGGQPFKCYECGKMFTRKSSLKSHLLIHTGVKPFKCEECGMMFTSSRNLNNHSVVHTGVKSFKCNECGKMFYRKSDLKMHLVIHTGVKSLKCNECGKMFTREKYLRTHSVVHTGVKAFKCNECGKMFSRKSDLKRHLFIHTGVKSFKCNECGKMFSTSSNLKMHSVVHTGVKPFKCNECGKMFTTSSNLKMHSVVHTGLKPFKCNECGKMFTTSSILKSHSLIHTGVKPFKCNECGKTFSHKRYLNMHSVIHTGVKRFKCNECGKIFTTSGKLERHSVVHTGVKRFKCNVCGKMFTQSGHLRRHSRIHSVVNPL